MILRRLPGWTAMPQPFAEVGKLRSELDELLQGAAPSGSSAGVYPLINLSEDLDAFYIRAELPGMKAQDIDISTQGTTLLLSGERKITQENGGANYHRRERNAGTFRRAVSLPSDVETDKVEARYVDGVLTIKLPKPEESKPRKITVQV